MFIFSFLNFLKKLIINFVYYRKKEIARVVYKSSNFIIIDKAFDIKINSNNKYEKTVQTFLKFNYPENASNSLFHEYYFMHRLDYSTSGLMCIPVHKKACQVASKAMQTRLSKKYYLALVRGVFSKEILNIQFPIGRDTSVKEVEKMCVCSDTSKSAQTLIAVLEEGTYNNYLSSKILVRPITGRRHQIRVHCSAIGHTIIGDYTYSNRKDTEPFRMFLHSFRLVIPNEFEYLDVQTSDPFTEEKIKNWTPVINVFTMAMLVAQSIYTTRE